MPRRGLFVTGTGTGVGKSVVAAAIIAGLTARGVRTAAFKPAVSGLDEPTEGWPMDHELLAQATGWQSPSSVTPHTFGPAVSPHLAAEQEGLLIELDQLLRAFDEVAALADVTICEGVGGLLVPLSTDPDLSVLGFAKALALPVVVATHPGLGTISDTRLTVDRLISEGLDVAGVVLSAWPEQPGELELSNRETLARLIGAPIATLGVTSPERLAEDARDLPLSRWLREPS